MSEMRCGIDGRYIQDHFPGIGRYTYNLALHLAQIAPDDEWVVLHDPYAINSRYDLRTLACLPNVTMAAAPAGVFGLRQQTLLPRLARRYRLDLYHAPYYVMPYALPCPAVVTIHDVIPALYPESLPHPRLRPVFTALIRLAVRRASYVLVDSTATWQDLCRLTQLRPDRALAIPLGVEDDFHPRAGAELGGVRWRLGLERPYLLYFGINKPHKNLVRLVEAWAALPTSVRAGHLLVLAGGEDPRYPEARRRAAQLGLEAHVRFLGEVATADVPLLYAGALAFVFPSLYEGFGLPVLEAMACGVPVACARSASLPEIVGDAALMFDPYSVEEIRAALMQLLTEPELRQRLAVSGRERARHFTWRRTAERTLAVLRRLV